MMIAVQAVTIPKNTEINLNYCHSEPQLTVIHTQGSLPAIQKQEKRNRTASF
jgi:hypothetical protein